MSTLIPEAILKQKFPDPPVVYSFTLGMPQWLLIFLQVIYFLDVFGIFETFDQIWTRGPPKSYQNASTNARTIVDTILKILICIFENLKISPISFI